jgi:hypothetical protein
MKKKPIIIIFIFLFAGLSLVLFYRYNLKFGRTIQQKSMMVGCMNKMLSETDFTKSKNICECRIGFLITKYSEDILKKDLKYDQILSTDSIRLAACYKQVMGTIPPRDTSKLYYKVGLLNNLGNNQIQEIEAYVNKENDTLVNQIRFYNNGKLDSTKSKFFELIISGPKDSVMTGHVTFFSPRDTLSNKRIHERSVTFHYVQSENDSIVIKEIRGTTNSITFPYRNFMNFTFMGYISDIRFITKEITNYSLEVEVNHVKFAIDNNTSTDNTYVDLLK